MSASIVRIVSSSCGLVILEQSIVVKAVVTKEQNRVLPDLPFVGIINCVGPILVTSGGGVLQGYIPSRLQWLITLDSKKIVLQSSYYAFPWRGCDVSASIVRVVSSSCGLVILEQSTVVKADVTKELLGILYLFNKEFDINVMLVGAMPSQVEIEVDAEDASPELVESMVHHFPLQ